MSSVRSIAEEAGVSITTVSRVLNNDVTVAAKTRDLVLSVANRNGYVAKLGRRITTYIGFAYTVGQTLSSVYDSALLEGVCRGVALKYLELSARSDGGIAYRARNPGPSRPPITAAAVCCWYNAGDYVNPLAKRALEFCRGTLGRNEGTLGHFFYAHLYYAQAVYLSGDEAMWNAYYPMIRDRLLREQNADGSWMGDGVGYPYGTALALIILQLPYNRLPIMQR